MKNVNKIDYHRTRSFPPLRPRIQDTRQNGLQFSIISDAPWLLTKYGNSKGGLLIFYFRQSMRIGTTPRDGSNCVKHYTIHQFGNRSTIRSEDHEKKKTELDDLQYCSELLLYCNITGSEMFKNYVVFGR